ncbi:MAG: antibiotic biosynthesis monooxygenase [Betaproteobacteria bacterium]|nr:antibiotic biosynthesis monooxygenase [Betaproteobacteria bacterium]
MILEIAVIRVKAGQTGQFENAFREASRVISAAKGYRSHELVRSIENSGKYVLLVRWDSVESHMEGFRNSADFKEWRDLIGSYFEVAPEVEHGQTVTDARL